ncbi:MULTISPECIES: alpha-amylase family glycosyl hydrolase [unclassified Novosphingobium]|uniref:alpha-amylase family glycosyl hydrolase n=1 Tax=unclassified Novosphingobium TaxID=2644732 RepID=UPI0014946E3C|nr:MULTISPECIES: alpha-amylase family glycosyl hydrolase [unclassified Novosphingobium]MBB3356792.1 glycosidase [Novosphingobium sp. BK256]MBB3373193.1 glycosidase [Novosphingobium sp. BK280]MBB3377562.1 glycosidase [Novosphingobium sp. BK258]MBB3419027.1 glycosidase [Novosphingobium sp. BK267]MBB3450138.1 glycosidase [Novosphingobium sp. BK352]
MKARLASALAAALVTTALAPAMAAPAPVPAASAVAARPAAGESIYFVLPDRFANGDTANDAGGIAGGRLQSGFDPADKGFYHGGDIKGLIAKLDYIKGMGFTALWVGPIFKNKAVQGAPGQESAGYHGYWITDFTQVDPHFGTNAEFAALVNAAHAHGLKVYMDIVVNHTADVIQYREVPPGTAAPYRDKANYPYSRKGGLAGPAINPGFAGDSDSSPANFKALTDPSYAYTPFIPKGDEHVKVPDWLNDPIYYHNRGDSTFSGENSRFGDFSGLDDVFTENPRVRAGMIAIYGDWIRKFHVDGYRIDTARHVDPGFWQVFIPAMEAVARGQGIPNFTIFGEVARENPDNGYIARFTRRDGYPHVLDFAFHAAVRAVLAQDKGTDVLADLFDGDVLYEGGDKAALAQPTFIDNHDIGRFAWLVEHDRPGIGQDELLARTALAHTMLLTLRGSPVVYYGDEQGMIGHGNDQAARQDMFASKVASYNDQPLLSTTRTTAQDNFNPAHPLYTLIARLNALRAAHPALARGAQLTRSYGEKPGLFSVSRFDPVTGAEYLIAFNTSGQPIKAASTIGTSAQRLESLLGQCPAMVAAPGSIVLDLPAYGSAVCRVLSSSSPKQGQ